MDYFALLSVGYILCFLNLFAFSVPKSGFMPILFPCGICSKSVNSNHRSIQCDICNQWIHIKCNKLSGSDYEYLQRSDDSWYCLKCTCELFPFSDFNANSDHSNSRNAPSSYLKDMFSNLNQALESHQESEEADNDPTLPIKCQYMDIKEFNVAKFNTLKPFSLLHINIASLSHNFEDLHETLSAINIKFDVIGISETRITKDCLPMSNLNIQNYCFESSPTGTSAGGTGLFILEDLVYKRRSDLSSISSISFSFLDN